MTLAQGYRHEALLYDGMADYASQVGGFIAGGLAEGENVVVAVPGIHGDVLRTALGEQARRVDWIDMAEAGRNPGAIIGMWRERLAACAGGPVRAVGEPVWAGRSDTELRECSHHEALLNKAFPQATSLWLVCPYDVASLESGTIGDARMRHPVVREHGQALHSSSYDEVATVRAALTEPLEPAPMSASGLAFDELSLQAVRGLVARHATASGLSADLTQRLVLATHELAVNSIRHGGGHGVLRVWDEGRDVVCEVADGGCIEDPFVGRRAPYAESGRGRGVWLAHELCDLVQVRSGPAGTRVRLHMDSRALSRAA